MSRNIAHNMWVSIENPDDPRGMPIYEGVIESAYRKLVDGRYVGHDEFGYAVIVWVENGDTVRAKYVP